MKNIIKGLLVCVFIVFFGLMIGYFFVAYCKEQSRIFDQIKKEQKK